MTAYEILSFAPVNDVDAEKVEEIAANIKANGWVGAPVLVMASMAQMITGSHRLAALRAIVAEYDDAVMSDDWETADSLDNILNSDCAEAVDDIINDYCEAEDCTIDDLPYDSLSEIFAGTEVEQYAGEIAEW